MRNICILDNMCINSWGFAGNSGREGGGGGRMSGEEGEGGGEEKDMHKLHFQPLFSLFHKEKIFCVCVCLCEYFVFPERFIS